MSHALKAVGAMVACAVLTGRSLGAEPVTEEAVTDAIREYVRCKYAGDDECVRARAHHDIARRTVADTYWGRPSTEWVRPYSHDVLQFYGTDRNETRRADPENGRCDIQVFDIESRTASASVVMEDVVDFLHLVLFEGRWVIADSAVIILDDTGDEPSPASREDEAEIRAIVRDYCKGFYELNGAKVRATCHPILSKRVVEHWGQSEGRGFDYFRSITWEEIEILGETFNKPFGFDPEKNRCEIDVYEIRGNIASAKLTAAVWFDYFHLMKVNGEWTIVNIMFEGLPDDRCEPGNRRAQ